MFWKSKPPTYKQRVDEFWDWFETVARRFYDAIEAGNCGDLQQEIGPRVSQLWDELQWVFGPGPVHRGGHSFTVSGAGVVHRQFLAHYWAERAPEIEGWTFYGSRQPGDLSESTAIGIDDDQFDLAGLHLAPELDEEREVANVEVWHEVFQRVDKPKREIALFLLLDEVLGEFGTDQWLGSIDIVERRPEGAIAALEFRDYLHDLEVKRGWKKLPPTESLTTYRLPHPDRQFTRSDTIVGTTANMRLVEEWLHGQGPLDEDPLADSGAEFAFLSFPSSALPKGEEAEFRGQVEEQLSEQLGAGGKVLGGALGATATYVDLLLLDGPRSLAAVRAAARRMQLPRPRELRYFAKGRRPQRI